MKNQRLFKLAGIVKENINEGQSKTVDRYVAKHKTADNTYISVISFGTNDNIGDAKLFTTKAAVEDHIKKVGRDSWMPIKVKVTIREV